MTMERIIRTLTRSGWRRRHGHGTHVVLYCPCGEHVVTVSVSEKNRTSARRNALRDIARCPRAPVLKP